MTRHRYKVVFTRDEDNAIIANCPTLQGCTTDGLTMEEALYNIREAMALCVEDAIAHDEPIPDDDTGPGTVEFEV